MPKKTKPIDQAKANEALLKSILAELKAAKAKLKKQSHAQKKTTRELHSIKKSLKEAKLCKCCKGKKKKSKQKKSTPKGADTGNGIQVTSLANVISEPRGGVADDLKWISGVGPKLEDTLNGLGIYHFEQIEAWTQSEIDWVDDYLKFSGRIERDNWIEQAKTLAKGGWDEYVKVFGKEPR